MQAEGPMLEILLRRLIDCPPEFWDANCIATYPLNKFTLHVQALLADHFRSMVSDYVMATSIRKMPIETANHGQLLGVTVWLLHDPWFLKRPELVEPMHRLVFSNKIYGLASMVATEHFVVDPDRREELCRICLADLGLRPLGESVAQASDRLTTLDSVERDRILKATLAAEKRTKEVREAMELANAQESASRYGE